MSRKASTYQVGHRRSSKKQYGWLLILVLFLTIALAAGLYGYTATKQDTDATDTLEITNEPKPYDTLVYPEE